MLLPQHASHKSQSILMDIGRVGDDGLQIVQEILDKFLLEHEDLRPYLTDHIEVMFLTKTYEESPTDLFLRYATCLKQNIG